MKYNKKQKKAAHHKRGHVFVDSPAGTGKTAIAILRCIVLLKRNVNPKRILMLTFTNAAAKEIKNRIQSVIGSRALLIKACTFHSFFMSIIRSNPLVFSRSSAVVLEPSDQQGIMKMARAQHVTKKMAFPKVESLCKWHSYIRNTKTSPIKFLRSVPDLNKKVRKRIIKTFNEYERLKKRNNYVDFDDMLVLFLEALQESTEFKEKIKSQFDHIIVDEAQDNNTLQWEILNILKDPSQLFCIGDPGQSIYSFRGADFESLSRFTNEIGNVTVYNLTTNYRSYQEILDLANYILSQSPYNYNTDMKARRGECEKKPVLYDFMTPEEEDNWIGDRIIKAHNAGYNWKDIMILVRNGTEASKIELVLKEKKIPYRIFGGTSIVKSKHIKELMNTMRAALNMRDILAWTDVLSRQKGVADVTAHRLIASMQEHKTIEEALNCLRESKKINSKIISAINGIINNLKNPSQAITDYLRILEPILEYEYEGNWEKRKKDLKLLAKIAKQFNSVSSFVDTYSLEPIENIELKKRENDDTVTLTTIHSAKGKEASVCFIPRLMPGMYPEKHSIGSEAQVEEERRVLYVAITRAKDKLIMTRSLSFRNHFVLPYGTISPHSRRSTPYFFEKLPNRLHKHKTIGIKPIVE